MKRSYAIFSFFFFAVMFGIGGDIERNRVALGAGFLEMLACLLLAFIFALLAGVFEEHYE